MAAKYWVEMKIKGKDGDKNIDVEVDLGIDKALVADAAKVETIKSVVNNDASKFIKIVKGFLRNL